MIPDMYNSTLILRTPKFKQSNVLGGGGAGWLLVWRKVA